LEQTLDVYDGLADYLHHLEISQEEVVKSIIGVIGNMDAYQLPDAKGYTSLSRYLLGVTDEYRQQRRDEVLATTPQAFNELGELLQAFKEHGRVVVLGSAEAIQKANEKRGEEWLTVKKVM
jgi:Zn-dependent M16 (insulinase) family peptidase